MDSKMIRQLPVKLPESFKEALGYPGDCKWVAFYWEPCGDEVMFDDGYCSGDCNWWGFLEFVRHHTVAPWLASYYIGASDCEAKHWLLCNLENHEVYVGDKKQVRNFLEEEAKKTLPGSCIPEGGQVVIPSFEDFMNNVREMMAQVPAPSIVEIQERMRQEEEAVRNMVAELGI